MAVFSIKSARVQNTIGNVFLVWQTNSAYSSLYAIVSSDAAGEEDFRPHDTLAVNVYRAECITHRMRDCQQHFATLCNASGVIRGMQQLIVLVWQGTEVVLRVR